MEIDRAALMTIRAWVEVGSSEPLRARIRLTNDVSVGFQRHLTLARPEDVCAAVQAWLTDIVRDDAAAFLTAVEAARVFRLSVRTIARWAEEGRLPYQHEAGERLFARRDLEAMSLRWDDPGG